MGLLLGGGGRHERARDGAQSAHPVPPRGALPAFRTACGPRSAQPGSYPERFVPELNRSRPGPRLATVLTGWQMVRSNSTH